MRVGEDHLERRDDLLGLRTAADVQEVRGAAAGLCDDVESRHHEARPVPQDAHLAVELDVGHAALAGHLLLRISRLHVAHGSGVRVLVERVVVDRDLGVERAQHALRRHDQGVDLDEHRVLRAEAAVERLQDLRDLLVLLRRDPGRERELARDPWVVAGERIEVHPRERLRTLRRDLLDLDAALRREHQQRPLGAAVEGDREVVLTLDLGGLLDPEPPHDVAGDVEPEDVTGELLRLVRVLRELDAAGLAAPAGQHLRLDDDGASELLGGGASLGGRQRDAALGDGDAVAGEQFLALVLVEVHAVRFLIGEGRESEDRRLPAYLTVIEARTRRVFGKGRWSAFSEFLSSW